MPVEGMSESLSLSALRSDALKRAMCNRWNKWWHETRHIRTCGVVLPRTHARTPCPCNRWWPHARCVPDPMKGGAVFTTADSSVPTKHILRFDAALIHRLRSNFSFKSARLHQPGHVKSRDCPTCRAQEDREHNFFSEKQYTSGHR